eukprot:CAMPEP_0177216616 /NCGR_PEP_ID=MMETSP0367-20130122/34850_1 /TAXON_ID=447022 ORGANISM="Scrippsiella hangoei-like, Strain SHHI-4" /NCGR_SAMPLE_ID=MMETSP0367 /ASSEMBLY_ACC=CAM_ASM_000362 /LENGTH=75 /DNA_ID=CAMNT_0018666139 /DNA_START=576 /DNA_END=800 /DNA_ORIENTATION=-
MLLPRREQARHAGEAGRWPGASACPGLGGGAAGAAASEGAPDARPASSNKGDTVHASQGPPSQTPIGAGSGTEAS